MRYFLVGRAVGGSDVIPFTFVKQMAKQYLSVTYHINCIAARCLINMVYLTACAFIRS